MLLVSCYEPCGAVVKKPCQRTTVFIELFKITLAFWFVRVGKRICIPGMVQRNDTVRTIIPEWVKNVVYT